MGGITGSPASVMVVLPVAAVPPVPVSQIALSNNAIYVSFSTSILNPSKLEGLNPSVLEKHYQNGNALGFSEHDLRREFGEIEGLASQNVAIS